MPRILSQISCKTIYSHSQLIIIVSKKSFRKQSSEAGRGYFILVKIYNEMGKHERALREYGQVGRESKVKSESHNNRAIIFIQ